MFGVITARAGSHRALACVAVFLCAGALVGCGSSGSTSTSTPTEKTTSSATATTTPAGPQSVGKLCASTCSDGEGDYVGRLKVVHNAETSNPSGVIVAVPVKVEITASGKIEADPSGFELIDSRKHALQPLAAVRQKGTKAPVPECPAERALFLKGGDIHTFHPCYELPDSNDLPKVMKLGEEEEVPLQ